MWFAFSFQSTTIPTMRTLDRNKNQSRFTLTHCRRLKIRTLRKITVYDRISIRSSTQDFTPSTLTSCLLAISHVHKLNGLQDPCSSFVYKKYWLELLSSNRQLMWEYQLLGLSCTNSLILYNVQYPSYSILFRAIF